MASSHCISVGKNELFLLLLMANEVLKYWKNVEGFTTWNVSN